MATWYIFCQFLPNFAQPEVGQIDDFQDGRQGLYKQNCNYAYFNTCQIRKKIVYMVLRSHAKICRKIFVNERIIFHFIYCKDDLFNKFRWLDSIIISKEDKKRKFNIKV